MKRAAADFAEGLAELPADSAVFVAEVDGRIVGYAYVLPSPEDNVPARTSELGSLYVMEDVAGTEWLSLMDATVQHARAAGQASSRSGYAERTAVPATSTRSTACGQMGPSAPVPHDVIPIEIHEIRYRMQLDPRGPL